MDVTTQICHLSKCTINPLNTYRWVRRTHESRETIRGKKCPFHNVPAAVSKLDLPPPVAGRGTQSWLDYL